MQKRMKRLLESKTMGNNVFQTHVLTETVAAYTWQVQSMHKFKPDTIPVLKWTFSTTHNQETI